jgi:hypothetical protein
MFCVPELAGMEPTPPAPEKQGMPAFANNTGSGKSIAIVKGKAHRKNAIPLKYTTYDW